MILSSELVCRCGHCKTLAPEYEKAAGETSVALAKVDATVETELGKKFDIKGFPTLKFFKASGSSDRKMKRLTKLIEQSVLSYLDLATSSDKILNWDSFSGRLI